MIDPLGPLLKQLAKHFVGIIICDEDSEPPPYPSYSRVQLLSGFLVSVGQRWFVVTAGHILKRVVEDDILAKGREITRAHLHVGWSLEGNAHEPEPFSYRHTDYWYVDDEEAGLDYGVIPLSPYYIKHLSYLGMVPLNEHFWKPPNTQMNYDGFAIVGIPDEQISIKAVFKRGEPPPVITATLSLAMLEEEPNPPEVLKKTNVRFYGKLISPDAPTFRGEFFLKDIQGMSGGPVFGFVPERDHHRIFVIGVQSGWDHATRIIAACPLRTLLDEIERVSLAHDSMPKS